MNKEDILKTFPDYEEIPITSSEGNFDIKISYLNETGFNTMWLKPKPKFPIVFENNSFKVEVNNRGDLCIEVNIDLRRIHIYSENMLLLEQAMSESKRIRGLKWKQK